MLALDLQPYIGVENRGSKELMNHMEPLYKIPSRTIFSRTVIPELHRDTVMAVKQRIHVDFQEGVEAISLIMPKLRQDWRTASDEWSSQFWNLFKTWKPGGILKEAICLELATSETSVPNLTPQEWKAVAGLVKTLEPIALATKDLSGHKYATLLSVVLFLYGTQMVLKDCIAADDGTSEFARNLLKSMRTRFPGQDEQKEYVLATACDPRFKNLFCAEPFQATRHLELARPELHLPPEEESSDFAEASTSTAHKERAYIGCSRLNLTLKTPCFSRLHFLGTSGLHCTALLEEVRKRNPVWRDSGVRFIDAVGHQLDRLLDYRSVMEGAENRDKRMSCTVNLLRFYREEVGRQEMFVRYVHKLCELHLPAEHFAEAAFALRLHADLLPWEESEQGRLKEQLYLSMLHYFDRGKASCWEEGLPLCKELATVYEGVLFDYEKLSTILRMHAQFLEHILRELRPEPEYFRVGFFGLGFPSFLRNKVFVYRGLAYEKVGAFSQRLQGQFPEAQLLTHNAPLDTALLASPDQYIQVCGVRPLAEARPDLEGRPECVRAYFRVNRVHSFQFDRPVYRDGPPDRDNEFKGLWLERTTLETASALPGLLPWAEVVGQQAEWVPPLVHACEAVEAMSNELRRLVALHSRDPHRPLAPLSMRLTGAIEAAVNGGLAKYHQASPLWVFAFLSSGDASSEGQARLRSLLLDQVHVLEGGLSLHGRLAPLDLAPLQKRLVERLGQLQQAVRGASVHGSPRPGSACSSSRSSTSSSGLVLLTHDEPWDGTNSSSSSSTLADQQQIEGSAADGVPPPLPPRGPPPSEPHVIQPVSANHNSLKHGDTPQPCKSGDLGKGEASNGDYTPVGCTATHGDL
ncbi:hypothetical protein HPB50_014410 [Hyalomma asiaticum]|uniref:Uncharacterized protein n=1 Tax=Hyalomma asiaticum TaxID=266040 RepID=A0ACB7S358_HYAAI|nr:hypothetical protein HPB50_014410 [Hyalomma asiaticum]